MDSSERRAYHHGDLRHALIDAAVAAARQEGPSAVVLRDIARRVGVSHNAGYRHFASRDDLLGAVAEVGLAELAAEMRRGMDAAPKRRNPAERARGRLRAIGQAYVHFALNERGLFRTVWAAAALVADTPGGPTGPAPTGPGGGPGGPGSSVAETSDPYAILNAVLDEFVECGAIPASRRRFSEVAAWSAVHGLSTLVLDGLLGALSPAEIDLALDRLCNVIDAGL